MLQGLAAAGRQSASFSPEPAARRILFVHGPVRSRVRDMICEIEGFGFKVQVGDAAAQIEPLLAKESFIGALVDLGQDRAEAGHRRALEILDAAPGFPMLAFIDYGESEKTELVDLVRLRALIDYHTLPADTGRLLLTLGHMAGMAALSRRSREAVHADDEPHMLGRCPAMREVFVSIRRVASVDLPVLVTGESGTGKDLVARAIHERSDNRNGPFVAINCAGLSSTLIQSELFGHEKGAFTGAHQRKIGKLEAARGGTCFLDEIGDFPAEVQGNLLRFLQEGVIERVGGTTPIHTNTRIVAATNVDLDKAIENGQFRADLFYRLNGIRIHLPPLRERGDDVELIATYFLRKVARELKRPITGFRRDAVAAIAQHSWPGNVRELITSIRRAVVMASGSRIAAADLGLADAPNGAKWNLPSLDEARAAAERRLLQDALRKRQFNVLRAAREIGVSRMTFYRLLNKHRIQVGDAESSDSPVD
ncbi:MAG: sigma-54 interaction domain-containing protein [Alphaproteobacteria bacterium]